MARTVATTLEGIHGIPVTPFCDDRSVDEAALTDVVARIARSGVDVVVACGNTSEYAALTDKEAERVAALTIDACEGIPTLVGVGGPLEKSIEQARKGVTRGASGVMIHFPSDPYLSDAGLVSYYGTLAAAVDGDVVLYVRQRTPSASVVGAMIEIENVRAIKYAIPDVLAFAEFAAEYGEAIVPICGLAEMWAPFFWLAGARGFTSGLVNVAPDLSVEMLGALRRGDLAAAMSIWHLIAPFERLRARDRNSLNVTVVKEAMVLAGLIEAGTVRPPISALREEERAELAAVLATWSARA